MSERIFTGLFRNMGEPIQFTSSSKSVLITGLIEIDLDLPLKFSRRRSLVFSAIKISSLKLLLFKKGFRRTSYRLYN